MAQPTPVLRRGECLENCESFLLQIRDIASGKVEVEVEGIGRGGVCSVAGVTNCRGLEPAISRLWGKKGVYTTLVRMD